MNNVAVVVVNFNTAAYTAECLRSLDMVGFAFVELIIVENGSEFDDRELLLREISGLRSPVHLIRSQRNIGFAGACNLGISRALTNPSVERVLLLNSDAVALSEMQQWLVSSTGDLCSAKVSSYADPCRIDSMGIVMYRSLLASNRASADDPLIGPTGGCALYSRKLLEDVLCVHGYVFDPDFFCYAEDTDLAIRSVLLGYAPEYTDMAVARHRGQVSSGGPLSDFVLYHGIRNSIWVMLKCLPGSVIARRLPFVLLAHAGIVLKHTRQGRLRVVLSLYTDVLRCHPRLARLRTITMNTRRISNGQLCKLISPRFYDRQYVRKALAELIVGCR